MTDSTGAVVPGVDVIAKNVDTNVANTTQTNNVGLYSLVNLPVGRYAVTFKKSGFKTLERPIITLAVAQIAQIDVKLDIGAQTEVVIVTEDAPLLQTQSSETGTNMKHDVVNDLPLSVDGGRRLELFAYKVTPSVEGNDWWSNIGGSQAFTKEVVIDGTSTYAQIQGDLMESTPSMDAVQEFNVQTSGISAENGRASGGLMIFNLKSGANKWHGSASYFIHNEVFDANTWDNGWKGATDQCGSLVAVVNGACRKPRARFMDYAFTGGGAIIKNKTFFYVAYEKFSQKDFRLGGLSQTVPIPAFLNGDFSALLDRNTVLGTDGAGNTIYKGAIFDPTTHNVFVNNVIPTGRISSVSQKIIDLYKKGYAPTGSGLYNNNALTLGNSPYQVPDELSIKGDHVFNDKNRLMASWIYNLRPRTLVDGGGIWAPGTEDGGPLARSRQQHVVSNQWRASDSHTFTPNVLHVMSLTYNEYKNASLALASGGNWPTTLGFTGTGVGNFPEVNFGDSRNGWNETDIGYSSSGGYVGATYILNDSVSWVKGRHSMKFGGEFRAMQINSASAAGTLHFDFSPDQTGAPGAAYAQDVGFGFASMLLGAVQKANMDTPFRLYGRRKYMAMFAQDDFKLNSRLTLNLGLRWESTFPFHEKFGHWANFDQTLMNPTWGIPGTLVYAKNGSDSFEKNRDWKEFGPHLGFAYQVERNLVVRGAYAITYTPLGINYWFGVPYGFAPGFKGTNEVHPNGTQAAFNWDSGYPGVFVPGTPDPNNIPWGPVNIDPNSLKQGYIHQMSFGVQYELAKDTKLDISYLGNRGRRLHEGTLDANQLDATTYLNWYDRYSAHAYDWVWDQASANAVGVPWYPANPYGAYMAYQAMSTFPQVSMLYGPLYYVGTPKGKSAYDALQVEVTKRSGHGLLLDFSYIYSKTRGNVATNFDELWYNGSFQDYSKLDQEASVLSNWDQKHVFKGYFTYELPIGRGKPYLSSSSSRIANAILGGWKIGAVLRYNTGVPITLYSKNYYPGWSAVYPNIAANADLGSHFDASTFDPQNVASNRYFNANIATNPPDGQFGGGPVRLDGLRGFGAAAEDANLMKNFSFGPENRFRMTFRFQMYNIFNRHYFSDPDGHVGASTFGLVSSVTGSPRQGQFDIRFQF